MNTRLKRLLIDILVAICSVVAGFFGSSVLSSCGSTWNVDTQLKLERSMESDGSVGFISFDGFDLA